MSNTIERLADACAGCKQITPIVPATHTGGLSDSQCFDAVAELAITRGWLKSDDGQGRRILICPACAPLATRPPPPFNPKGNCPKCGHRKLGLQFVSRGPAPFDFEHLKRTCARCGYAWAESPKDLSQGTP